MNLKKYLSFFGYTLILAAGGAAQRTPISQLPDNEPFKITSGSSFSASSPHSQGAGGRTNPGTRNKIALDVEEALDVIRKNYSGPVANRDVVKSSIESMLRTLDPHSTYFDAEEYRELREDQHSEYSGIGTTISNYEHDGVLDTYVVATFAGSAAEKARLKFGDRIAAVDGEPMTGRTSDYVRDRVRGRSGSVVKLRIERADSGRIEAIELRRGRVPQPSIPDAYILRDGIGYIDLTEGFNYTTATEFETALKELRGRGMNSLVLDLRGNTGGILDQAVKVVEKFVPAGSVVVTQRGRFRIDNRIWKSNNPSAETMPVVVLVDDNSASASEVVAGALQDHDRALILGVKTFGKGLVQSVIDLPAGSGLTITTARYFTPSGRSIQRDYSDGSLYDYFNHRTNDAEVKPRNATETATHRKVYGGDGIEPDEVLKGDQMTREQIDLLDPLFFFSTRLVNGKIPGFERRAQTSATNQAAEIGNDAINAFLASLRNNASTASLVRFADADRAFVARRLRYNLAMATAGQIGANRSLIKSDPQINAAVLAIPRAAQLAQAARRVYQAANKK